MNQHPRTICICGTNKSCIMTPQTIFNIFSLTDISPLRFVRPKQINKEFHFIAEREGFEPSIAVTHYAGLANLCLQPLGHLSELKNVISNKTKRTAKSNAIILQ